MLTDEGRASSTQLPSRVQLCRSGWPYCLNSSVAPGFVAGPPVLLDVEGDCRTRPAASSRRMRERAELHVEMQSCLTVPATSVRRSAEQLEAEEQAQRDLERLRLIREKRCAPPRSRLPPHTL